MFAAKEADLFQFRVKPQSSTIPAQVRTHSHRFPPEQECQTFCILSCAKNKKAFFQALYAVLKYGLHCI